MQLLKGQFAPEPIQLDRLQCAALAPEVDRGLQFGSVLGVELHPRGLGGRFHG